MGLVNDTLPISEVFGQTLQGEGPAAGQVAYFVRFMGCNLSCSWCDTSYTWDATRHDLHAGITWMTPTQVFDQIPNPGPVVVITGGEPLLQQDRPAFLELLDLLTDRRVHVETNGTVLPSKDVLASAEVICVSPKLAHAGRHRGHQNPAMPPEWVDLVAHPNLYLKVVCQDAWDVATTVELAKRFHWPLSRVWVMPEGTTVDVLTNRWPTVANAAAQYGINATHRLHVLAWGDERGH
jgi:organic radical activating enzyme